MAFDLLRSAKHIRGLNNAEFRVLFYLLESAHHESYECFPSMKKIARYTDMSERTVQRHISALAERGLFERVEQRRNDGSRSVNCYIFRASGTMQIGRESIIQLGPINGEDEDQQPANIDGLRNPPVSTPPPVKTDTTPRQDCRDIDQESEPAIRTDSPLPTEGAPIQGEQDLFGKSLVPAEPDMDIVAWVESEWAELKLEHPGIAGIRKIDDGLAHTLRLRTKQHRLDGETDIALWHRVFQEIRISPFLQGRTPPRPGSDNAFKLSLGWLLGASKFREVINGKYSNRSASRHAYDGEGNRLTQSEQVARQSVESMLAHRARRRQERGG